MDEPKLTGNHIEQDLVGILTPDEIRSKRELGRSIMLGENNKYAPGHAVKFLTDAARAGDARALAYLAECYYTGKGTARDPLKAFDLALDSAEAGDPYGSYVAGLIYYEGGAGEKDYYQAVRYLTEAANAGVAKAMRLLGSCCYDGTGVSKDIYKARHWFEMASRSGDEQARRTYEALTREIEKREEKLALLNKAMSGDRDARITALKDCNKSLRDKKSFESALMQEEIALIEQLRDSEDPEIQYLLFECYYTLLRNTDDKERAQALKEDTLHYLEQSALTGKYPPALHRLGISYQSGNLHEKDPESALTCFLAASEQGYAESMLSVSYIYEEKKDLQKAFDWTKMAFEQESKDGRIPNSDLSKRMMDLSQQMSGKNKTKHKKDSTPKIESQPGKKRSSLHFSFFWHDIDFNVYGILGAIGLYLMTVLYRALGAGLLTQPLINIHGLARFILVIISAAGVFFGIFVSLLSILMQAGLEFLAFYPSAILSLFIIVELHDHAQYFTYMTYFTLAVTAINLIFIAVRTIRKY